MCHRKTSISWLLILPILATCATTVDSTNAFSATATNEPLEILLTAQELPTVSGGMVDIFNRFSSTVRISAPVVVPSKGLEKTTCSGLLVSNRVVLTAGHCVCHPRRSDRTSESIIDQRSQCAETASVQLLQYKPRSDLLGEVKDLGDVTKTWSRPYVGAVEVHHDINIVYTHATKKGGKTTKTVRSTKSSSADLAVILLRESLEGDPAYGGHAGSALPWRTGPLEINDEVVIVGFGPDGGDSDIGEQRHHGNNNIIAMKSDGTAFTIGQQITVEAIYAGERPSLERLLASYALPGDSGGPCYLEKDGIVVGIVKSVTDGEFMLSSCTNLRPYLEWLRTKIAKADDVD